ncbi:MAG: NADH-quinone oxidoreductase subunit NuoE [Firmicutes bacterium]|nr:NADH-quinone oxidoreductase subunit NuoE [Bacillota bacterium]
MELSEEEKRQAVEVSRKIATGYGRSKGNLIPILQNVQDELGYVPLPAMQEVAAHLGVPPVDVYSVVTFYNQFRLNPPGKHRVKVCLGTACHMKGGQIIMESWERRLNIKAGETTADREFSLERVACVGCCTLAPVVLVDEEVNPRFTPTKVDGVLFAHGLAKKGEKEGNGA